MVASCYLPLFVGCITAVVAALFVKIFVEVVSFYVVGLALQQGLG